MRKNINIDFLFSEKYLDIRSSNDFNDTKKAIMFFSAIRNKGGYVEPTTVELIKKTGGDVKPSQEKRKYYYYDLRQFRTSNIQGCDIRQNGVLTLKRALGREFVEDHIIFLEHESNALLCLSAELAEAIDRFDKKNGYHTWTTYSTEDFDPNKYSNEKFYKDITNVITGVKSIEELAKKLNITTKDHWRDPGKVVPFLLYMMALGFAEWSKTKKDSFCFSFEKVNEEFKNIFSMSYLTQTIVENKFAHHYFANSAQEFFFTLQFLQIQAVAEFLKNTYLAKEVMDFVDPTPTPKRIAKKVGFKSETDLSNIKMIYLLLGEMSFARLDKPNPRHPEDRLFEIDAIQVDGHEITKQEIKAIAMTLEQENPAVFSGISKQDTAKGLSLTSQQLKVIEEKATGILDYKKSEKSENINLNLNASPIKQGDQQISSASLFGGSQPKKDDIGAVDYEDINSVVSALQKLNSDGKVTPPSGFSRDYCYDLSKLPGEDPAKQIAVRLKIALNFKGIVDRNTGTKLLLTFNQHNAVQKYSIKLSESSTKGYGNTK